VDGAKSTASPVLVHCVITNGLPEAPLFRKLRKGPYTRSILMIRRIGDSGFPYDFQGNHWWSLCVCKRCMIPSTCQFLNKKAINKIVAAAFSGNRMPASRVRSGAWRLAGLALALSGVLTSCSQQVDGVVGDVDHPETSVPAPRRDLEITGWAWRKTGYGGAMQASFTIQNNSKFPVRDIAIACIQRGDEGKVVKTEEETVHELWKPGETRTVRDFTIGSRHHQTLTSAGSILAWTAVTPEGEARVQLPAAKTGQGQPLLSKGSGM
jgi:hypothetical protein